MKNRWIVKVLTLFPEMFPGPLSQSIAGRALEESKWSLEIIDIKKYVTEKENIDDAPYGGGPGMVIKPDVLHRAYKKASNNKNKLKGIMLSPRGKPLTQKKSENDQQDGRSNFSMW